MREGCNGSDSLAGRGLAMFGLRGLAEGIASHPMPMLEMETRGDFLASLRGLSLCYELAFCGGVHEVDGGAVEKGGVEAVGAGRVCTDYRSIDAPLEVITKFITLVS